MSRMDQRLSKLETTILPDTVKPALTFLWGSEADDPALAAMERQAEAEERRLIVIRIVGPSAQENTHVTT